MCWTNRGQRNITSQATSPLKLHHLSNYITSQATSPLKLHHLSSYITSQATSPHLTCSFTRHLQSPSALVETFHPLHYAGEDKLYLQDPYFHSFTRHAQSLLVLNPFLLVSKRVRALLAVCSSCSSPPEPSHCSASCLLVSVCSLGSKLFVDRRHGESAACIR